MGCQTPPCLSLIARYETGAVRLGKAALFRRYVIRSRSIEVNWRSIRFRLAPRTYDAPRTERTRGARPPDEIKKHPHARCAPPPPLARYTNSDPASIFYRLKLAHVSCLCFCSAPNRLPVTMFHYYPTSPCKKGWVKMDGANVISSFTGSSSPTWAASLSAKRTQFDDHPSFHTTLHHHACLQKRVF